MGLIECLRAFVATAQSGSFTEAGERLGISNRLTSKYVGDLERRLGTRLLQRTTRQVGLTSVGRNILLRAPALLEELDEMIGLAKEESQGVSGTLRILAPVAFSETYLHRLLCRFAKVHPSLSIDLRVSNSVDDLAAGGFDLAFQVGQPEGYSQKVRRLGTIRTHLVASPEYLNAHSRPKTPEELKDHVCLIDTNYRNARRWTFSKGGEEHSVALAKSYMADNAQIIVNWALAGLGVAISPSFLISEKLQNGHLVPLLEEYESMAYSINATYLGGKIVPSKVRALIDFAVEDVKHFLRHDYE